MENLEKAVDCCSSNLEALFRYGAELVNDIFEETKDRKPQSQVNEILIKAGKHLKKCIKQSYFDSLIVRDAYYYLALICMFFKDDEALKYKKQGKYAYRRIPKCVKSFVGESAAEVGVPSEFHHIVQEKLPYADIKTTCDECDQFRKELKKCSCKTAFYCGKECQVKHWKIHQDTCPTKRSQNRPKNA